MGRTAPFRFSRNRKRTGTIGFYKHEAETRSLHTAVFNAVEKLLREKNAITDVVEAYDYSQWAPALFHDGQLVRTTGLVRLLDYPWLASVMETMPRMLKVTQRAELSALKQQREQHKVTQQEVDQKVKEQQSQLKDLEAWKMEELTEVVRELYGQTVRIKIVPDEGSERGRNVRRVMSPARLRGIGGDPIAEVPRLRCGCEVVGSLGLMNVAGESNTAPDADGQRGGRHVRTAGAGGEPGAPSGECAGVSIDVDYPARDLPGNLNSRVIRRILRYGRQCRVLISSDIHDSRKTESLSSGTCRSQVLLHLFVVRPHFFRLFQLHNCRRIPACHQQRGPIHPACVKIVRVQFRGLLVLLQCLVQLIVTEVYGRQRQSRIYKRRRLLNHCKVFPLRLREPPSTGVSVPQRIMHHSVRGRHLPWRGSKA